MSPLVSVSAALQSIIPAPVALRSAATSFALKSLTTVAPLVSCARLAARRGGRLAATRLVARRCGRLLLLLGRREPRLALALRPSGLFPRPALRLGPGLLLLGREHPRRLRRHVLDLRAGPIAPTGRELLALLDRVGDDAAHQVRGAD